MATQLEFSYYRTIDRSEVDLIIEGDFGTVPVEISLCSVTKKTALRGLENFLADTSSPLGGVVNSGKRPELRRKRSCSFR